jgi:hypothetical protein
MQSLPDPESLDLISIPPSLIARHRPVVPRTTAVPQ